MNAPPAGRGDTLLALLVRIEECGAEVCRHGSFVGVKNIARLPPGLLAEVEAREGDLVRLLRNEPSPYQRWLERAKRKGR